MRWRLIASLVSLGDAPVALRPCGPILGVDRARPGGEVEDGRAQSIFSSSIGSPKARRSQTTLWPAKRPIGQPCWQDITQTWLPSSVNQATSPAANSLASPSIFRLGLTGETAEVIAGNREELGKRAGLHASADHGPGIDTLTRGKGGTAGVHRLPAETSGRASTPSVARASAMTGRCALAHVRPDPLGAVGKNDARLRLGVGRQGGAATEPASPVATSTPGQSGADHEHGGAPGRAWRAGEPGEMRAKTHRGVIGVDIECMLAESRDGRPDEATARGRKDQAGRRRAGEEFARCGTGHGSVSDAEARDLRHPPA